MNRTLQPEIQELVQFNILPPERTVMPNGVPLTVINAGEQDVVRVDILFGGGRWQQSKKLQALFANRMLREGSRKYTAAEIAVIAIASTPHAPASASLITACPRIEHPTPWMK